MNNDSCRLMLLNLYSFVKNRFTNKSFFDFEHFERSCTIAQRMMDNLVDLELEKIDAILNKIESDPEPEEEKQCERNMWINFRKNCVDGRRTGLGITGLGDAIAALGIRFGSDESIVVTELIYKALAVNSYRSSIQLAKERGSFPIFDIDLEEKHPFINQILNEDEQMKADFYTYGRRNISITTTAPAGSVSYETQTTSGIESAFLLELIKRRKVDKDKGEKVDFTDESGDSWQEYEVSHKPFADWKEVTGLTKVEDSPYYLSTANEIDPIKSVHQQAAAQKWVCNAISRTVNLPRETTVEQVSQIYLEGWRSGCKGITVYRDGSRNAVLMSKSEQQKPSAFFTNSDAAKRPATLKCDIHRLTIQGEKWIVVVGLLDDKPYEVFAGLSNKVELSKKHVSGKLMKNSKKTVRSTYDLTIGEGDDQFTILDLVTVFDNKNNAMVTRLISLALRHGSSIKYAVEQLSKDETDDFTSFSKVVARTLKKYIKDGEKVTSDKTCPSCKSEGLVYVEGCTSCLACGFSKCS